MNRIVLVYIAMSLDGFIAGKNDDMTFLDSVKVEGEDYGYEEFINSVDTIIMGRKTYNWVMNQVSEFPNSDKKVFIITHFEEPADGQIQFYTSSLTELVRTLKLQIGKNIFVDGGAQIINQLLAENLIDEFIISVVPVLLGGGTKLFANNIGQMNFECVDAKLFPSGLVKLHYRKSKV